MTLVIVLGREQSRVRRMSEGMSHAANPHSINVIAYFDCTPVSAFLGRLWPTVG
jgi:hypothetical protein